MVPLWNSLPSGEEKCYDASNCGSAVRGKFRVLRGYEAPQLPSGCVCMLRTSVMSELCDPTDESPPGSSVHGTLQARTLECVALPPPGHLPDPEIKLVSPTSPAL